MDGLPELKDATPTHRKDVSFRLSIRLAPSQPGEEAEKVLRSYFDSVKARYNAKLEIIDV